MLSAETVFGVLCVCVPALSHTQRPQRESTRERVTTHAWKCNDPRGDGRGSRRVATSSAKRRGWLGGRSAEEIVFGKITTGAANDLQRATDLAEQMVGTYGMSDTLGPLAYDKQGGGRFLGGNNNPRRSVSDATAQAIDKEVRGLVDRAHDDALAILRQNMALLETIAQKILEKEVIEGDDLKQMLEASVLPETVSA